ncbi:MAG: metallophosphoesterase [Colwellia sp.]
MTAKQFPLVVAQISDSHLFADINGLHCGANVLQNLTRVLSDIAARDTIDYVVFTGDLTQDHSERSYQHFVNAVQAVNLSIPVFFLAGNHDDPKLMNRYLSNKPFSPDKTINETQWQIQLIDSKSETPAGFVSDNSLQKLTRNIDKNKFQLVFMHHHPVDVGYFIDKHGLQNKAEFWSAIKQIKSLKAIACGHVHRAMLLKAASVINEQCVDVYTCPATSIQFDPTQKVVVASKVQQQPAYGIFFLYDDGTLKRTIVTL